MLGMAPSSPCPMPNITSINAALPKILVQEFSGRILGMPYDDLKKVVYPKPRYRSFVISKRNGMPRAIDEPLKELKSFQRQILSYLESLSSEPQDCVHGFVKNRSILTNAQQHCSPRTKHILNIDLEDFFPSITFKRVRGALRKHPFYFSHQVASLVAHICTREGILPQGAPTSPFISNLICRGLDRDLRNLARKNRAIYTRYADDITFSFSHPHKEKLPHNVCVWDSGKVSVGDVLNQTVVNHGFTINAAKTRLSDKYTKMEVTGLTINKFPNVSRRFVDQIRGALHAWETYGYEDAQKSWEGKVLASTGKPIRERAWQRQTRIDVPPRLKNLIWGRLLYLGMVRGKDDLLYTRLAERYNFLCDIERVDKTFIAPSLKVEPVAQDLKTAEDAIFVVKWDGKIGVDAVGGEGTAFAYKELNFLVTCNHVLEDVYSEHKFHTDYLSTDVIEKNLILIRPKSKESFPARVLYRNKQFDIAILAFDMETLPSHTYFASTPVAIEVGAPGKLIGFPSYRRWNPPDFLDEKVLNLLEPNRGQKLLSITGAGSIRPGNSGGPFVDSSFRVAGVALQGAYLGSGHDICLASSVLDQLIQTWRDHATPELEVLHTLRIAPKIIEAIVVPITMPILIHASPELTQNSNWWARTIFSILRIAGRIRDFLK
ncbi:reverse transcriptase domain-containing protein [Duganella sp. LjRoot269]|uniref:reverse transcriptase domain-containing protein n=1 Tax=Duganella sp. LjRoot269 TaxID=3342305 RepID=UPI003ECFF906